MSNDALAKIRERKAAQAQQQSQSVGAAQAQNPAEDPGANSEGPAPESPAQVSNPANNPSGQVEAGEDVQTLTDDELEELEIDSLEDIPLDMIEDSAQFLTFPKGQYHLLIQSCAADTVGSGEKEKAGYKLIIENVETLELSDPSENPPAKGSMFSMFYGEGKPVKMFKTIFGPIAKQLGATTVGEMREILNGVEIVATVGVRSYTPEGSNEARHNNTLSNITLV